jgi:hypothetical protein
MPLENNTIKIFFSDIAGPACFSLAGLHLEKGYQENGIVVGIIVDMLLQINPCQVR